MQQPSRSTLDALQKWASQKQEISDDDILAQMQKFDEAVGEEENLRNNMTPELLAKMTQQIPEHQERSDKVIMEQASEVEQHFAEEEEMRNRWLREGFLKNKEYHLPEAK